MQPVTQLILLQELLRQILQVTLGELNSIACNSDAMAGGVTGNLNGGSQLTSLAIHLELVVEEVLEGGRVEDGIVDGTAAVDYEFARFGGGGGGVLQTLLGWMARRRCYLSHSVPKKS